MLLLKLPKKAICILNTYLTRPCSLEMEKMLKVGRTNKRGGESWDEKGNLEVVEIIISHGSSDIKGIHFTYCANGNNIIHSQIHGQLNGLKFNKVPSYLPN